MKFPLFFLLIHIFLLFIFLVTSYVLFKLLLTYSLFKLFVSIFFIAIARVEPKYSPCHETLQSGEPHPKRIMTSRAVLSVERAGQYAGEHAVRRGKNPLAQPSHGI